MTAPFASPSFRRLWSGAFLSSIGTWIQDVALAWVIHTSSRDPLHLGLRSFAAEVPLLAFMLLGGAVADRVDRRRILLTSQALQMSFAAILAALYFSGHLGLPAILLIAFATGLAQSQSAPTYQAVLVTLVPPGQIQNAVALNSLQFNLSRTLGPAVAGLLLASGGTGACFVLNAVSFTAVIAAISRLELPPQAPRVPGQTLRESLLVGLRFVMDHPLLGLLTALAAGASFLALPLLTYLPVIATESIGAGAGGFSLLMSSFGAGAIAGALATAQRGSRPGRGRLLLGGFALFGASTAIAALATHQLLAMALLFVAGASLSTAFSILSSLVQEQAPDELRGRIVSIYGLAFRGGMPLGSLLAGVLARSLGAPTVVAGFALTLGLVALVLALRVPRLRSC